MPKKSDNVLIRATREQLYSMAACSTFGTAKVLIIDHKSYDPDTGNIRAAVEMRDTSPEQRKKDAHENGYAYYQFNKSGHIKTLKEDEL